MCGLAGRRGRGQWSGWACLECAEKRIERGRLAAKASKTEPFGLRCGAGALHPSRCSQLSSQQALLRAHLAMRDRAMPESIPQTAVASVGGGGGVVAR